MSNDTRIPLSKRAYCSSCGRQVWKSRTSASVQKCRPCRRADPARGSVLKNPDGIEWDCAWCGKHCSRPATRGQLPKHCGDECQNRAAAQRRPERVCQWCGSSYVPTYNIQKSCSLSCGQWLRHYGSPSSCTDLALISTPPQIRRPRNEQRPGRNPWWRVIVQGNCSWCGRGFTSLSTTGDARYCSSRCGKRSYRAARRRARGTFAISERRRERIYDRDDWTCQICGTATTYAWAAGDPWSPTLDHIEPQSHSLIPDHSDANLRMAHAICNGLRSDAVLTDEEVRSLAIARRWSYEPPCRL